MNYIRKEDNWKAYMVIGIIIGLIIGIYFTFFFYYGCSDLSCYQAHQKDCAKTKFVKDGEDTTWKYTVMGRTDGKCSVNVEVLDVKKGSADKKILIGKDMDCLLPLGSLVAPESDISRCNGILKEEMQTLIIKKLHAYIVENVQDIGGELEGIGEI